MTNREAFIEYLQEQFDSIKILSDEGLVLCSDLSCHKQLWAFAFRKGKHWKYPQSGFPSSPRQREEMVQWLKEEAKEDF